MDKYKKEMLGKLDVTKSELKTIGEAIKNEKFRDLFKDFVNEVNDPENQRIYESEIRQLEKERGVDITFVRPSPGYVLKTGVEGSKAYINVCYSDKIEAPTCTPDVRNGRSGGSWSIPHLQNKGKLDVDKRGNTIVVYDVIFHPRALDLAHQNASFKSLVNDTAMTAVEDRDGVQLDRNNFRYSKKPYWGPATPCVVRHVAESEPGESFDIPNYPYPEMKSDPKPQRVAPRPQTTGYTAPTYTIKQRRGVDFIEFTDAPDSKFHSAIPTNLIVEIDLPLLKSASDVTLDILGRFLNLKSESPAKYALNLKLPYSVTETGGSAKFEKDTKRLVVDLPVERRNVELMREDSGIESDTHQTRSSSEEDVSEEPPTDSQKTEHFLSPDLHYSFPPFTISSSNVKLRSVLSVKNVDPDSVSHQFLLPSTFHIRLTSVGAGLFPVHYAFCLRIDGKVDSNSLKVEVWDNNVVTSIRCSFNGKLHFWAGPDPDHLDKFPFPGSKEVLSQSEDEEAEKGKENQLPAITEQAGTKSKSVQVGKTESDQELNKLKTEKTPSKPVDKEPNQRQAEKKKRNKTKTRTSSESNITLPNSRRSILKGSRSLSESNTDECFHWSSIDSNESPEENSIVKKTVRFSDVVYKKLFRANSCILGQKKKNRNQRKKAQARRASESEADTEGDTECESVSEVSDTTDVSESSDDNDHPPTTQMESSKKHRRRGSKNRRKNAATAKLNWCMD